MNREWAEENNILDSENFKKFYLKFRDSRKELTSEEEMTKFLDQIGMEYGDIYHSELQSLIVYELTGAFMERWKDDTYSTIIENTQPTSKSIAEVEMELAIWSYTPDVDDKDDGEKYVIVKYKLIGDPVYRYYVTSQEGYDDDESINVESSEIILTLTAQEIKNIRDQISSISELD